MKCPDCGAGGGAMFGLPHGERWPCEPWCSTSEQRDLVSQGNNMQTMTLVQISERFENATQNRNDLAAVRAEVAELLQRAGDVSVSADEEQDKDFIVECLRWTLEMIDAGQVQQ